MATKKEIDQILIKTFSDALVGELKEMKKFGIKVSTKALKNASDPAIVKEYAINNSITVGETADLFISLY